MEAPCCLTSCDRPLPVADPMGLTTTLQELHQLSTYVPESEQPNPKFLSLIVRENCGSKCGRKRRKLLRDLAKPYNCTTVNGSVRPGTAVYSNYHGSGLPGTTIYHTYHAGNMPSSAIHSYHGDDRPGSSIYGTYHSSCRPVGSSLKDLVLQFLPKSGTVSTLVTTERASSPVVSRQDSGNKSNPSSPVKSQKSLSSSDATLVRSRSLDDLDISKLVLEDGETKSSCYSSRFDIDNVSQRISKLCVN